MNSNRRLARFQRSIWGAILVVVGFLLCQPDTALAQVTGSGTIGKIPKWSTTSSLTDSVLYDNGNGNVGIGTLNPSERVHLFSSTAGTILRQLFQNTSSTGYTEERFLSDTNADFRFGLGGSATAGFGGNMAYVTTVTSHVLAFGTVNIERMRIDTSGNVGIGTTAPTTKLQVSGSVTVKAAGSDSGNISADGTISGGNVIAKYQDVAEWVPSSRAIPAGTVVVLDAEQSNNVLPSSRAYDTSVAGVVSAKPGVILGEGGAGKVMVATTGRVKVKVDATNAPIRVGDLLVTSDKEGIAMRSQPLDLGGTPIHRPGTLIGKALEPLDRGVGEILVLLSLQ